MATFEVTDPSGRVRRIQAPSGTSSEVIAETMLARYYQEEAARAEEERAAALARVDTPIEREESTTLLGNMLRGTGAGAINMLESAALGLATPLGEESETAARDVIKSVADFVRPRLANPQEVSAKLFQGVGSILGLAPTVLLGPAALPAAAAISAAAGAGEASERAREKGASEEDRALASRFGVIPGALDVIPFGRFARAAGVDIGDIPVIGDMINKLGPDAVEGLVSRVQRAAISGGVEGAQEVAQEIGQNLIERNIYNPDASVLGGTLESGLVGGGSGAIVQGLLDLAVGRRARGGGAPETPQLPAPEERLGLPAPDRAALPAPDRAALPAPGIAGLLEAPSSPVARLEADIREAERDATAAASRIEALRQKEIAPTEQAAIEVEGREQDPYFRPMEEELDTIRRAGERISRAKEDIATIEGRPEEFETARTQQAVQREEELLGSVPTEDTAAEIERAVERQGAPETALGMAAQQAAARRIEARAPEQARIAEAAAREAEARAAETARVEQATAQEEAAYLRSQRPPSIPEPRDITPTERPPAAPMQPSLPGVGRRYGEKTQQARMDAARERLAAPAPRILDEATLDKLRIPKTAPVRKRVMDKDFNTPEVRQELIDYGNNPRTPKVPQLLIDRFVKDVPPEQLEAFMPRGMKDEDLPVFGDKIPTSEFKPSRGGAGPAGGLRRNRPPRGDAAPQTEGAPGRSVVNAANNVINANDRARGFDAPVDQVVEAVGNQPGYVIKYYQAPTSKKLSQEETAQAKPAAGRPAGRQTREEKKPVTEAKKPPVDLTPKLSADGRYRLPFSEEQIAEFRRQGKVTKPRVESMMRRIIPVFQDTGGRTGSTKAILAKDPLTKADRDAIKTLLEKPRTRGSDADAAARFFTVHDSPVMGLEDMAWADILGARRYRKGVGETDIEAAYMRHQGKEYAAKARKWVEANLSPEALNWYKTNTTDNIRIVEQEIARNLEDKARHDALTKGEFRVVYMGSHVRFRALPSDSVVHLGLPLHPEAIRGLGAGNLRGALRILFSTANSDRVSDIAKKLLDVVGDTKVEVVENLKSPDGTPLAGLFDPKTNTIKLDSVMGINTHTLLHEATHMAVSATLAKPGHPLTKQLTKLFENAKGSLENFYGAQSVDEFVSEVFSNPEFQAELAQLNESGKPVSMLQQFMNIVGNFLRRMVGLQPKGITSALNAADRMIESIIAPAPDTRAANELFMLSRFGGAARVLNGALNNMPPITKDSAERFVNFIKDRNIPLRARQALQYVTPLHGATEIAEKYIPGASKLNEIVRRQSGVINKGQEAIDAVIKGISSWGRSNPEKLAIFDELVVLSTSGEVDPELSQTDAQKKYGSDPERMKDWRDAKRMFNEIGDGGRTQYRTLRNTYKALLGDIQSTLRKRLRDEVGDAEGQAIYNEINKALVANGAIDPYFPLFRRGDYWVTYTATNPRTGKPDFFAEAFESKTAAQTAIKQLKATGGATDINEYTSRGQIDYSKAPSTAFVNDILKTMKVNGIEPKKKASDPDTLADQVVRLYLDSIPERSMLQGFRQRKGTPGAKKDAVLALRNKGMGIVRQLAQIEHGREIQQYRNEIDEYVKTQKQKPEVDIEQSALLDNIKEDLDRRARFAASPNIANWSKFGSSLGFNFTLGFNASAALINLTALPMILYPYLAGKYGGPGVAGTARGYVEAARALGTAIKVFMSSGKERQIETYGPDGTSKVKRTVSAAPSIDNYDFDAANTPPEIKMRRALAEVAAEQGALNRSITQEVLDMEGMDTSAASTLQKINMASGFMFHHLERAQRQISLDTAYQMELSKRVGVPVNELGAAYASGRISDADMQAAAREAVYITEMTNGGVQAAGAPPIAQNNIGRIAFMFKRYGVSMYYMLWKLSENSIKGSPADKAMARRQLAGVFGATGLLAGVGGMPIFGTMAMIANMFLEDDEEDFQTMTRQYLGEGVYGGLGNYLFGVDISARIGLSELIFRENRIAKDQSIFFTALEELGGPVVGLGMGIERGLDMISQGDTTRGLEAMSPAAIRNVMKGIRFATEGANTMRGDSIVDDIGIGHSLAQALGFAPAEYSRQLMENAALKKIDRAVAKERTNILRRLYISARSGDSEGVRDAVERLRRFNSRHANAAITADSVKRSMKSHQKTSAEMHHGITLNKNMRATLQAEARDFDKNVSIWD